MLVVGCCHYYNYFFIINEKGLGLRTVSHRDGFSRDQLPSECPQINSSSCIRPSDRETGPHKQPISTNIKKIEKRTPTYKKWL